MEPQRLGNYRLLSPLPTNSVTTRVYLTCHADDEQSQPAFVTKLMPVQTSETAALLQAQFEHEIKLLRAFNHPNIPTVHDDGEHAGVRYVVMDNIDGCNLSTFLGHDRKQPRALTKEMAVYIMGQLADAVRYCHGFTRIDEHGKEVPAGILHRDLNPQNILLSRHGDVMLCDFNSAKSPWLAPEHDTVDVGLKAYMAPERIIGSTPATQQSDLFSLAVILWEILKGQRCFQADSDLKTMDAIVRFDISHSGRRVTGLSTKLSEIVRKNLDRDPGRRYISAFQMLQRLAQAPEAAAAERSRGVLADQVVQIADAVAAAAR
ncbi:MAG: serine/threonine protein kinase [Nannocystaceae bacterium]